MDSTEFDRRIERIREIAGNYRLFFVCGAPKSGTTWLQKALNVHSQIVCVGEGHFADILIRSLRTPLKQYFDQQQVVANNVYEGKAYYRYERTEEFEFLALSFILNAFARLSIPAGTRLIGDKTPANVDHLDLFHHLVPEAKFINIVRDGRDTLVSTFKHVERVARRNGELPPDVEKMLLERTETYAARWVRSVENAQSFAAAHPGVLHTVRYEDLKQDFPTAFAVVLGFLGVDDSPAQVARCEAETSFRRLSGGRDAGEEDPSAFFRKGVVGDWRLGLSQHHLEIFNSVGAEWLVRLGYEPEPAKAAMSTSG